MKRSSATPAVAAMIAVLCRLVASTAAVSDGAFASAMMARRRLQSDDDDVVPFAGIVVYPSTKDNVTWNGTAGGGLATSQADYVKNELETDGQITVLSTVQLGALVCDTLPMAENAPRLKFEIGANETIIANQTSFYTVDGDVLPDGVTRHSWSGVVIDPEPNTEMAEPSTVSMSWGEECDVETFLWKERTVLLNGTTLVHKTIPCEAGGADDICLVEVSLDLAEEGESSEQTFSTTSSFAATGNLADRRLRNMNDGVAKADADLHILQDVSYTVQISVAMLYSENAMALLGNISEAQMSTFIVEAIESTNEAFINSEVPLVFELVYAGKVPYTPSEGDPLDEFAYNDEVVAIRDEYKADLVQLVGDVHDVCGEAYAYVRDDPLVGFSRVNPNCVDTFYHTHEFGFNMGCKDDRDNVLHQLEYSHGMRYCDDDVSSLERYITIMSNSCPGEEAPKVNFFSNPAVSYLGRPTGAEDANNARIIMENMLDVSSWRAKYFTGGECYTDDSHGVFTGPSFGDDTMTIERCAGICDGIGATDFGVQAGGECFCSATGDDLYALGVSSACNTACTGDASQMCGGTNAMNIYNFDNNTLNSVHRKNRL